MVADMFHPEEQQHAVLWASLWSCLGAVIGGVSRPKVRKVKQEYTNCVLQICGGPIQQFFPSWRVNFYVQLGFSVLTQALHFWFAKESRSTVLLGKAAKEMRKTGQEVYGPNEVRSKRERFQIKEILKTMWRPYQVCVICCDREK
jgi:hypothetical protein